MKTIARINFRQIEEESRYEAAELAWSRAEVASKLRHVAAARGNRRVASRLADVKRQAIRQVLRLQPNTVQVSIDDEYHVGLVSVSWPGHGKLHLPVDVDLNTHTREASVAS